MELFKYQGAGNDFLITDNRRGDIKISTDEIGRLCDRRYGVGADGLMLLENADGYDFRMVYYNSDGSGGMMCGNGGRCIVAFADSIMHQDSYSFIAADGPHTAEILVRSGLETIVKLRMRDVDTIEQCTDPDGVFLDTGTRHFVKKVDDIDICDVVGEGRVIRCLDKFGPIGVNVNFIQRRGDVLHVRTYEKGVEDETFACGTGITAAAIAESAPSTEPQHVDIQALRDRLCVDFTPIVSDGTIVGATDVFLTGPATFVAKVLLP